MRCVALARVALALALAASGVAEAGPPRFRLVRLDAAPLNRIGFSVTRLADGRVLVAGGARPGALSALGTTTIFDPATRDFAPGPSLAVARRQHAAALLPGGRVLIAGGFSVSYVVATAAAEILDPDGASERIADMLVARGDQPFLAPLADGSATVLGGTTEGRFAESADLVERWDPAARRWMPAGRLLLPCHARAWLRLPGDTVLRLPSGQHRCCGSALTPACAEWAEERDLRTGTGRLLEGLASLRTCPDLSAWLDPRHVVTLATVGPRPVTTVLASAAGPVRLSAWPSDECPGAVVAASDPDQLIVLGSESWMLYPVTGAPPDRLDLPPFEGAIAAVRVGPDEVLILGDLAPASGARGAPPTQAFLLVRDDAPRAPAARP